LAERLKAKRTKRSVAAGKRWLRDRAGKQQALIEAFDQLLQQEGAHRIGVNAVVKRAKVGKSLLYQYFGGLDGLASAWAQGADLLPTDAEIMGRDAAAYARLTTGEQLTRNYQRYAKALRSRPRTLEILASELVGPTDITRAIERERTRYGQGLTRFFSRPDEYASDEVVALQVLLYGAICYLSLRSRTAPDYFGLRLDDPNDWKRIEAMLALVVRRALGSEKPGEKAHERTKVRRPARRPARRKRATIGPNGQLR
jgi:AcrR family transcriptional regulator